MIRRASAILLPAAACVLIAIHSAAAQEAHTYQARDTLKLTQVDDPAAKRTLDALRWKPGKFTVTVEPGDPAESDADAIVRFPSPRPMADRPAEWNTVAMEWYRPAGKPAGAKTPAVLVLHSLDPNMTAAHGVARTLAKRGIAAFILHDPGYALRLGPHPWYDVSDLLERAAQAASDARRARDAIAALPGVDPDRISLQGTSLGAFIGSLTASMDHAFVNTYLLCGGANLYQMFHHGHREAQWIREALTRAGVSDAKLRKMCDELEPANVAARLDPKHTWLISARFDQVVPDENANALSSAAKLSGDHHRWIDTDHYTALLELPWLINEMVKQIDSHS